MSTNQDSSDTPGVPGLHLIEIPYRDAGHEVQSPDGGTSALPTKFQTWTDEGPWPEGARLTHFAKIPVRGRLPMAQWTWQEGKWEEDSGEVRALRAVIFPDYGGAYCFDQYDCCEDCDLKLGGVPGAEALDQDFSAWEAKFEVISIDDLYDGASPMSGWETFSSEGLGLCRRFVTLMGPEGVVLYRRDAFSPRVEMESILLYWEIASANS